MSSTDRPSAPSAEIAAFLVRYGTLVALALLLAFNFALTRNFATLQTLNVNLTQVCNIVILGVGMTLVIATGGIDLSVGALMARSGALAPMISLARLWRSPTTLSGPQPPWSCRSLWRAFSASSMACLSRAHGYSPSWLL